jgi:hypothetical protein
MLLCNPEPTRGIPTAARISCLKRGRRAASPSDYGYVVDDARCGRLLPHPLFCISVENKGPGTNLPMRYPCMTLGRPLGWPKRGPKATQSQTQTQDRQRVAKLSRGLTAEHRMLGCQRALHGSLAILALSCRFLFALVKRLNRQRRENFKESQHSSPKGERVVHGLAAHCRAFTILQSPVLLKQSQQLLLPSIDYCRSPTSATCWLCKAESAKM